MRYASLLLLAGLLHMANAFGQVPLDQSIDFIEAGIGRQKTEAEMAEETDPPEWLYPLLQVDREPVNLNVAGRDELEAIPGLSDLLAFNVVAYRETYGTLVSIYELQAIDGFDLRLIRTIFPYITIGLGGAEGILPPRQLFRHGKHEFMLRAQRVLEERAGYRDGSGAADSPGRHYLGSPERLLFRYRYDIRNRVRLGFSSEKDPGEPLLSGRLEDGFPDGGKRRSSRGFDHNSGFFQLKGFGMIENLIVGDYQVVAGYGLTFGSGHSFGSTSVPGMARSRIQVLHPNGGTEENRFFRGIAATLAWKSARLTVLFSSLQTDARLDTTPSGGQLLASPNFSGLHRTGDELARKDVLKTRVGGIRLAGGTGRLRAGVTVSAVGYNAEIDPGKGPEDLYAQVRSEFLTLGFDYHYLIAKGSLFGEVAVNGRGSVARLHGFSFFLHPGLKVGMLYRDYSPAWDSPFANAYAAGTARNERGLLTSVSMQMPAGWNLDLHFDLCRFPWLRYRTDRPSRERGLVILAEKRTGDGGAFLFRLRMKDYQENVHDPATFTEALKDARKVSLQAGSRIPVSALMTLKNRVEFVIHREAAGNTFTGFFMSQDLKWKSRDERWTVDLRSALFDTDTFDERVYAYEPDVRFAFSVPAHYFRGMRTVVLIRLALTEAVTFWFKVGQTRYFDRDSIGSGPDEIQGSTITEVKGQLMVTIK